PPAALPTLLIPDSFDSGTGWRRLSNCTPVHRLDRRIAYACFTRYQSVTYATRAGTWGNPQSRVGLGATAEAVRIPNQCQRFPHSRLGCRAQSKRREELTASPAFHSDQQGWSIMKDSIVSLSARRCGSCLR